MGALAAFLVAALPFVVVSGACGGASGDDAKGPDAPGVPGPPGATATVPPAGPLAPIPVPPSGKYVGATPYDGGTEFRVWAPNARAVAVVGEAVGGGRRDLAREPGTGMFSSRIDGAHAGQRYHYAITTQDGTEIARADPRARRIDGAESVIVDPRSYEWKSKPFTPPAREATVVYEMHVGSFNAPSGALSGTFTTAIDKLDSLADLGVNAIEMMPVNGHGAHGWGYGPQQWYAPQPSYGAPDELRRFVDEAHSRGIAVMLDVVFNHYDNSSQAPLRCFDGTCPSPSAGIYFFDQDPYRKTPWGPRPDYSKKEVADFLADNVFAWTTEYRIDGFRQDSVSNIRAIDGQGTVPGGVEVLKRMNDVTLAAHPGALLVAEDLKGQASITAPSSSAQGLGFTSQWDGGFQYVVASAVAAATDDARNIGSVRDSLLGNYNGDAMERVLYVETHDTAGNDGARLPTRIDAADPASYAARKRGILAAGLLLTAPGVPMIFMGQEWLEATKFLSQPAPMDWSKASNNPVRAFYKDMIGLRRNLEGVSGGLRGKNIAVTQVNDTQASKVLVYRRWDKGGDDVVVIANFGATRYSRYDVGVPVAGNWQTRIDTDITKYGADFGSATPTPVTVTTATKDGLPVTAAVALGPYSMVVLSR
jgi:1,4-alpha-glucan branching enzyme